MKKIYLFLLMGLLFPIAGLAQVTVTNPTNTTPNLAATYTSLANAITALDGITSISGPLTITLAAGNPQTAPAGGYAIQFAATTTLANNITITGNNNIITAFTPQAAGSYNDAIFKIIGADYITLQNFTMQENVANTIINGGTNNMTEWGVALLYASPTNGAQNNIIQNNSISLNRTYTNTFGIYSNTRHDAITTSVTADITNNTTAPNSGNKVYSNAISNVNYGISFTGSGVTANQDAGNDIGGVSFATGNTLTNWGALLGSGLYVSSSLIPCGIFVNNQTGENVSFNTLTSAAVSGLAVNLYGIYKTYTIAPVGSFTSAITNNTITLSSGFSSGDLYAIYSDGMGTLSTATININNNNILNCVISGAASSSSFLIIFNSSAPGTLNIANNIIRGNTSTATHGGFTGIYNGGAVVNTINITNNKFGDAVSGAVTFSAATDIGITGINNAVSGAATTVNINNNSIDGLSAVTTDLVYFILGQGATAVAININNNKLGSVTGSLISFSGAQSAQILGIFTGPLGNCAISIQGNDIRGIVHSVTGSAYHSYIYSPKSVASLNISNNTFTNLNVNTTGGIDFITSSGNMSATGVCTTSNNSIVTAFNKSVAGGAVTFISYHDFSVNGSTMTETGNNFSNVTVTGSTPVYGIYDGEGASSSNGPAKTITGNTFNNITTGSGNFFIIEADKSATTNCSSNTLSNISGTGIITCIYIGANSGQGTFTCSSNIISNVAGSNVYGILQGNNTIPTVNINSNNLSGLSSTSTGLAGIEADGGGTVNIYDNVVHNLSNNYSGPGVYGINILSPTTVNVYKNKIYDLSASGVITTAFGAVFGMRFNNGYTTCTVYNNFISDLRAPNANSAAEPVQGITVTTLTASSTINLYYNSIYLNAISTGTNFGTAGIYHSTNATATTGALNMINNIIVNTSTPNGTGVTAAYQLSGTTLTNFASTSDYNLFYAGTPSASKLIFYDGTNSDQTLAAYQSRVSPRDANSISLMPNFTSATDLHLTTANCRIDGRATPTVITTDIDGQLRDPSTPDIGADEFTATYNTTLAVSAVCDDRTVSVTGTTFTSNACDLIAKVLPSGGAPVSGKINTCVTFDATQQYFNAEPYVQRHFDIEPVTFNTTTTSATITLYFTDAEFVNFNTNNPAWPKLPTSTLGNADPNRANLKVTQYHGTATTSPSKPGFYTGNAGAGFYIVPGASNVVWNGSYWAVIFPITGFSGFYVHTNISFALPISLNYFNGVKQGSNNLLDWMVSCNTTPDATLTIERSNGSGNFTGIYSITATALRCQQPFDYIDTQPLRGMNYYRLKMIDAGGKITYSNIIALLNAVKGFEWVNITPNPVTNGSFKLNITAAQPVKMDLVITDMQGRALRRQSISLVNGYNSFDMDVSNLASGTYNISGITAGDKTKVIRFIKE